MKECLFPLQNLIFLTLLNTCLYVRRNKSSFVGRAIMSEYQKKASRIRSLNSLESNENGDVNLVFACVALSISDNDSLDMRIYPNPTNGDFVTIQTSVNGDKYVEVFDITGKRLITTTLIADTLDISVLSSGIYLVNVTINGQTKVAKLIIK